MDKSTSKLEIIQLLRALAVMCVVISHIAHELSVIVGGKVVNFNSKLFPGDFGVDLFFVISGFIMVYICWDKFGKPGAMLDFWIKRLIRIIPLYWIATTLMILVVVLLPQKVNTATSDWGQWVASYLFIPYARESDGLIRPVLGLGWSLQYELLFYFLFGISLLFSRVKGIVLASGLLVALCIAANLVLNESGVSSTFIRFVSHPIILEFAAGVLIGYCYMKQLKMSKTASFIVGAAGVLLLLTVPDFNDAIDKQRYIHYGIPAVLIVMAVVFPKGYADLEVNKLGLHMGESSYAIYLIHPFIIGAVSLIFARLGLFDIMGLINVVLTFSVVVIFLSGFVGYVAHYFFDLPFTNMLRTKWHSISKKSA
jgi:exopolysaccharide production protein ExoZ